MPPGAGRKVDFPLLYEKSDPLAAGRSAACDSDTSGSDHAVDDEDGSDSEVSMRCEFVDSMAAETRSLHSDGGATSADSDPCTAQQISSVFFN